MAEINTEVVLNTSQVSQETSESLNNLGLIVQDFGYGWRILVEQDKIKAGLDGIPAELARLLRFAGSLSCKWLVLDCDAPVDKSFPEFIW